MWSQVVLIAELEIRILETPLTVPVRTSFGTMSSRQGLLVRLTDAHGHQGYGEIWCNFPEGGARYKGTLLTRYVRPALIGKAFSEPSQLLEHLETLFAVLRLQCADHGAFSQWMAGVDQAAWDLFCKAHQKPFWALWGGSPSVSVYASGIGPSRVGDVIREQEALGHQRFKIKLGFGDSTDQENIDIARAALPSNGELMVDVNQGWNLAQSLAWMPRLNDAGIVWCEEPLRADSAPSDWHRLSESAQNVRLAAGENLLGMRDLLEAITQGGIQVLQPDLGKWGGISLNLRLAETVKRLNAWFCPHWLSGGVGLLASLQLKSAIGGAGSVEIDANPNDQRSDAFATALVVQNGRVELPSTPGLIPELSDWVLDPKSWVTGIS